MDISNFEKILKIAQDKIDYDTSWKSWMDPDVLLAFDWLIDEAQEAKEEYINKKQVYLEDELCDIYWTIIRITELLSQENAIDKNRIFQRIEKKYSGRVYWLQEWKTWNEIKQTQKAELLEEQTDLDTKK